jgi:hypothetical protein
LDEVSGAECRVQWGKAFRAPFLVRFRVQCATRCFTQYAALLSGLFSANLPMQWSVVLPEVCDEN